MSDITIRLYGNLEEAAKANSLKTEYKDNTELLRASICRSFPFLEKLTFVIAVNKKIANQPISINPEDEIVLLPPFSGG